LKCLKQIGQSNKKYDWNSLSYGRFSTNWAKKKELSIISLSCEITSKILLTFRLILHQFHEWHIEFSAWKIDFPSCRTTDVRITAVVISLLSSCFNEILLASRIVKNTLKIVRLHVLHRQPISNCCYLDSLSITIIFLSKLLTKSLYFFFGLLLYRCWRLFYGKIEITIG